MFISPSDIKEIVITLEGNMAKTKEAIHPHGNHVCVCSTCNTEVTVGTSVKCNTQVCSKCGGPMLAKMAGEKRTKEATGELSADDKRDLLQTALVSHYRVAPNYEPDPTGLYISEVFDDYLIYRIGEQLYKSAYTIAEDGVPSFTGEPEKVSRKTVYTPIEALQAKFSEFIQEAGKRNASLDSARVKKIVELCQELLSSEAVEEEKANEAITQVDKGLLWLKERPLVKTEEGVKYPSTAYAYAPNDNPDTWQLRICETDGKACLPTKALLARASASLSPGGFKGQKAQIPGADLPAVKRRIRAAYRGLGVTDEDIPKWVSDPESREMIASYVPLTEAKFDKGRATVIVIKPGFNADESRYYPAEMLKRDYKVFEGMKMYADHPTDAEDKSLPERSIKSTGWVAVLKDVTCDEAGIVTGVAEIVEPWLMTKLATLRDKELLSEMGISINAVGKATESTIDDKKTLVIETLIACRSVDFVTEPGAGGIVTFYESDKGHDIDLVELSTLKELRPDLVKMIEADVRVETTKEVKRIMGLEEDIKTKDTEIEALTTERDSLKEANEKVVKEAAKAEAQATIKEAVDKAELPEAAKERLIERYKDAETADGIVEAIQSEVDYIAKLSEAGKVKGLGSSKEIPDAEKAKEALKEACKALNPDYTDAQVETFVTGR